ncbi:hypothetical protein ABH940_006695 [Streptacidiphilus sp. BW17]|uniref:DUF4236 domain-containing protein n=1 Tax=Streptacidiphilus sp. BW17 TaxID=3156274 RepID=UPI0035168372
MGFNYRKSFKAGPFRVTASKSGISYSAGVKGMRVTKRANGRVQTTLSAPGTGLRPTSTSGKKTTTRKATAKPAAAPRTSAPRPSAPPQPKLPTVEQVRASWRATGRILPTRDPRISPATAETVAGLMLIIAKPGEQMLLMVRINNLSPLRDTLILTNQRILLLHSKQALRGALANGSDRSPSVVIRLRSSAFSNKLIIEDASDGETLFAGSLNLKTLKWLREITAHDPLFQL